MNNPVARNALKSRVMASFQTVYRLRGDLLDVESPKWSASVIALNRHLVSEIEWLRGIEPLMDAREGDPRKPFVVRYARSVAVLLRALSEAVKKRPVNPKLFEPVGTELLAFLALEGEGRRL